MGQGKRKQEGERILLRRLSERKNTRSFTHTGSLASASLEHMGDFDFGLCCNEHGASPDVGLCEHLKRCNGRSPAVDDERFPE